MTVLKPLISFITCFGLALELFIGSPASAFANPGQCVYLDDKINLSCMDGDCLNGIFWKSKEGQGNYHPTMAWTSRDGKEAKSFEVIVADETGRQLTWPYPLGEGLYLSMTGSFSGTATAKGPEVSTSFDFKLDDPMRQYGHSPLARIELDSTPHATFHWDSNKGGYTMYIVNLGGNEISGRQYLNPLPNIYLIVRAVGVEGRTELANANSKMGLVCGSKPISITSPCTFQVEPTSIRFKDIDSTGALGLVQPVEQSKIYVSCSDSLHHKTYLRVTPADRNTANEKLANFKHSLGRDGRPFKGLNLVYKVNKEPQTCDDGDIWNQAQKFEQATSASNAKEEAGTIYWGLCRTSNPTDIGQYSTTAIVYFWVD